MLMRIYLEDWFYNMGIIGFLRILEQSQENFVEKKENYIEFEVQNLKSFHHNYFQYFFDIYNISKNAKERIEGSFKRIKTNIQDSTENNKKENQERLKIEKKNIKEYIKKQLDKIKKFDEDTYNIMLEQYNLIDKIKTIEDINKLEEVKNILCNCFEKESINNKLTLNLFKSILSNGYFGQPSFLNVSKTALTYEEQEQIMYKDYISNIIETDFLQSILKDKYTISEIIEHMSELNEELLTKEMKVAFNKLLKYIEKGKQLEEIKKYISENILNRCHMCNKDQVFTNTYTESNFVPLAISADNMKNFFWNQKATVPICDMCKLIMFCIPAGVTNIAKTVKENKNGKNVYKEKKICSFVNYDTSVEELLKQNNFFSICSQAENKMDSIYEAVILNIIGQNEQISEWKLDNIFVVEFEAEYGAYSRIEYFNIKRYVAKFFVEYSKKNIDCISDNKYKLEIVDYILKNKDIKNIINRRMREELGKNVKNRNGYNSFLATRTRLIINSLKKGDDVMKESIQIKSKKLYVVYNEGISIREELKKKGEDNKLTSYSYKMLNYIKSGNKQEFMDIAIRLHMMLQRNVSPIFLEAMKDDEVDFASIGHSFIAGLISDKYQTDKNNTDTKSNVAEI